MTNIDHFKLKFEAKSIEELQQIVDNPSNYQADAIAAAKLCLAEQGTYLEDEPKEIEKEEFAIDTSSRDALIVSRQMRLIHYLIDYVVIQLVTLVSMQLIYFSYSITGSYITYDLTSFIAPIDLVNYFVMFFFYYWLLEHFSQTTVGKMVTKTMVVDELGYKPSLSESFYRTLSRFIPFEAISCLAKPSRGWHDKLSGTYVIEKRNLDRFRNWNADMDTLEHLVQE